MENTTIKQILAVKAERGKQIPSPISLSCEVLIYSANDKVTLELAESPGINPTIMIVDVKVEKNDGPMKGIYTPVKREFPHNEQYEKVTVRYNGEEETTDILGF